MILSECVSNSRYNIPAPQCSQLRKKEKYLKGKKLKGENDNSLCGSKVLPVLQNVNF